MAILDELLVSLGYEFDDTDAEKFSKASKQLKNSVAAVSAAAVGATVALTALVKTSTAATDSMVKAARQTNVAVEEYDALTFASGQAVGNTEAIGGALQNLSIRASEAARGLGSGVEAFGLLGVEVNDANGKIKTTDKILLETADALNALEDQGQRLELADKLGLREIDLLLKTGSDGINKLTAEARELGVVTDAQGKAAEDFNDSFAAIGKVASAIQREIVTALLPAIQEVMDSIKEWFKINKELIKQNIGTFIEGVTGFLTTFWAALKAVGNILIFFVDKVGGLGNALKLVGLAITGILSLKFGAFLLLLIKRFKKAGLAALLFQAKLLLIPILIGAIVTAIAAFVEDAIVFFQGGESAIGKFLEQFPLVEEGFDLIGRAVTKAWELLKPFRDILFEIGSKILEFGSNAIKGIGILLGSGDEISSDTAGIVNNSNTSGNSTNIGEVTFQVTSDNPQQAAEKINAALSEIAEQGVKNTATQVVI